MLFNGEAIFGALNLSRDRQEIERAVEDLTRRSVRLGARCRYETIGAVVLGCVSRRSDDIHEGGQAEHTKVAVAGEVFSLVDGSLGERCKSYRWIAEGFEAEGDDFLTKLDGTFALTLWDPTKDRLTLTTDRRGDVQLFYRSAGNLLLFSSWLRLLAGGSDDLDRQAVQEFLRFFYVAAPRTIYRGIQRLSPGKYLTVVGGAIEERSLVKRDEKPPDSARLGSAEDALNGFHCLFEKAIRRRIGSRRVGIFLSSGVDSATIMAGCQKINPGSVEAFTVGFDNAELDETRVAQGYADHLGVPHTVLRFNLEQYRGAFDRLAGGFDQPFADPAGLPLLLASEAIKGQTDVLSGGTGGDDLFGAPIPRHLWFAATFSSKLPANVRAITKRMIKQARLAGLSSYASLFDFDETEELFITWPGWSKSELADLLGEPVSFVESGFYRTFKTYRQAGPQELYDALGVFPPDDCRFEAAAVADMPIELPYHDLELANYVHGLAPAFRTSNGVTKVLLRRLFDRYYAAGVPSVKKHYFNIPLQEVLSRSNYELVRGHLARETITRQGLVDPEKARRWIDRYLGGEENLKFKIWALLVLHAWLDARS